jgi:hypothetical protein
MSTYARLGHSLSDTDSLIPAQAEAHGRTATGLIQASTCRTNCHQEYQETPANQRNHWIHWDGLERTSWLLHGGGRGYEPLVPAHLIATSPTLLRRNW